MADFRTSDLTQTTSLSGTDLIEVSQDLGGGSYESRYLEIDDFKTEASAYRVEFGEIDGATGALSFGSSGVATSRLGVGMYRITFIPAMPNTNYGIMARPYNSNTGIDNITRVTTHVDIDLEDGGGSLTDFTFNFIITSEQF